MDPDFEVEEPVEVNQAEMTVMAHQKSINIAKFSPNDKFIASGSQDKSVKIWTAKELRQVMELKGHLKGIWDLEFSPTDKQIVTVSGDKLLKVWNISGDKAMCVATLQGHADQLIKVKWINTGLQLASASVDGVVKLWNLKKQTCVNTFEMHADKIWGMDLFEKITQIEGEDDSETEVKFQSKIMVITGGGDSTLKLWEDYTMEQELEDKVENLQRVQDEQKLSHLIRGQDYLQAAVLAFRLNKIRDFYHVLQKLVTKSDEQLDQVDAVVEDMNRFTRLQNTDFQFAQGKDDHSIIILSQIISKLLEMNTPKLLIMVRNLNCKYEYSQISQHLMKKILPSLDLSKVLESLNDKKIKAEDKVDLTALFETVQLYNQKHFSRMDRHLTHSYFVDYIVSLMTLQADEEPAMIEVKELGKKEIIVGKRKRSVSGEKDFLINKKRRKSKEAF